MPSRAGLLRGKIFNTEDTERRRGRRENPDRRFEILNFRSNSGSLTSFRDDSFSTLSFAEGIASPIGSSCWTPVESPETPSGRGTGLPKPERLAFPGESDGRVLASLFQFGQDEFGDFAKRLEDALAANGHRLEHGFALELQRAG
jgi:hypothetical protein